MAAQDKGGLPGDLDKHISPIRQSLHTAVKRQYIKLTDQDLLISYKGRTVYCYMGVGRQSKGPWSLMARTFF